MHRNTEVIYQTERSCLTTFLNTEKRFENMTRSGVFLMNFEVACEQALGKDGKTFSERETEEFREQSDRDVERGACRLCF